MVKYNPVAKVVEYNGVEYSIQDIKNFFYYYDQEIYNKVFYPLDSLNVINVGVITEDLMDMFINKSTVNIELSLSKYIGLKKACLI